jgi:hypothetical protein
MEQVLLSLHYRSRKLLTRREVAAILARRHQAICERLLAETTAIATRAAAKNRPNSAKNEIWLEEQDSNPRTAAGERRV